MRSKEELIELLWSVVDNDKQHDSDKLIDIRELLEGEV